jgi:hypothetical protein
MDFGGFDFSEYFSGAAGGAGAGRRPETGAGGFRDIFSQFFSGHGGPQPAQPEKGGDLEYVMDIDFWQALRGSQARINITRYDVCETCHGSGSTGSGEVTCPAAVMAASHAQKPSKSAYRPELATAPACVFPERAMPGPWARLREISTLRRKWKSTRSSTAKATTSK